MLAPRYSSYADPEAQGLTSVRDPHTLQRIEPRNPQQNLPFQCRHSHVPFVLDVATVYCNARITICILLDRRSRRRMRSALETCIEAVASGVCWILDTLFTIKTISEARDMSKARMEQTPE